MPPPALQTRHLTDAAAAALQACVGAAHLRLADAAHSHADPYAFGTVYRVEPAAVVLLASTDELRAVLAIARQHRLALWTVSTGKNLGYGGASPRTPGTVVVDLQRMNRVLEVNEELGYAVVEPGVRFLDLYAHLRTHGHRLLMSVPDIGWGSPIGNALERGFGYAPLWDHSANLCGLEVMLADGRSVRTGMGAMAGNATVIASMLTHRARWWTDPGPMPEHAVQAMAAALGLGRWNARFGLYGAASMTIARLGLVRQAVQALPGAQLETRQYPGDVDPARVHPADHAQLGIPGLALLRMAAWRGGTPDRTVGFSRLRTLPRAPGLHGRHQRRQRLQRPRAACGDRDHQERP